MNSGRLTSKQADATERRIRMTQQRQALSNRIRKQKKSQYLAKKRSIRAVTSTPYSPSKDLAGDAIKAYIQTPTVGNLEAVSKSLPSSEDALRAEPDKPLLFLSGDEQQIAEDFVGKLGSDAAPDRTQHSLCLNILQKLSAVSYTSMILEEGYYGKTPCTWSFLIVDQASLISLLINNVTKYESCLVILGNLSSDPSSQVCPKLRLGGLAPALISCIQQPTAAWALTNAIRHDTTAYASEYCSESLLSASMLESMLLSAPVATQAAWMAASILNREKETVQYFASHPSFCSTIVSLLQSPRPPDQTVPLIQSLGSIASYEINVPLLLALPSLLPTIVQLLQPSQTNKEVFQKTVWLSGCLLVDSRLENHPSSLQATPVLVPILFEYMRSEFLVLDLKQDVAMAILNAMDIPPSCDFNPHIPCLPFYLPDPSIVRGAILGGIVDLVKSSDTDAVASSVHILRLLLRQEGDFFKETMEEADVLSILEGLCNLDVDIEISEVAAEILDDFFYVDDLEEDERLIMVTQTVPADTPAIKTVPGDTINRIGILPSSGMGRGREAVKPSWMTK